ncbi:hypothetical protein PN36_20455 [Candidatus Thiomargarita nelsonii]|uniref:Uncharacterized protein n=1 Tax=Candidatus Thiomargarita nelsonii TaxID=1003181 RepID=A0A0A6PA56_9GAMM|nr:hypothetical protein PN36_20455 [Candidatus Thiomargarita nelsonii]
MKALALADAIIQPEWEYRYFSYNSKWSDTEEMGSFRDGSGGEWFFLSSGQFAGYKCLSPEDGIMPDLENVKSQFPSEYRSFITEPAFSMDLATCLWYLHESKWVKNGLTVKWIIDLAEITNWTAKDYHTWAVDYYERDFDVLDIDKLFENQFNEELAMKLNPEIDINKLRVELVEIGINS